jgi:hypothetical protein
MTIGDILVIVVILTLGVLMYLCLLTVFPWSWAALMWCSVSGLCAAGEVWLTRWKGEQALCNAG